MKKIPKNSVVVASNIDGVTEVQTYSLNEVMDENFAITIPVSDKIYDAAPACKRCDDLVKEDVPTTKIDPFIPYAMTLDQGNFLDPITIGISRGVYPDRGLWQKDSSGVTTRMTKSAIIGDDYGPVGIFVPNSSTVENLLETADTLMIMAENMSNRENPTDNMVDAISGRSCHIKKLR